MVNSNYILERDHAYHYQMKCIESVYGDFVVWRDEELFVERIYPDEEFMTNALTKSTIFFKYGMLPEQLVKFYTTLLTRVPAILPSDNSTTTTSKNLIMRSSQDLLQSLKHGATAKEKSLDR